MTSLSGKPILTAAEMRSAEEQAIASGATVQTLMDRAGREVAAMVARLASEHEVLVLCGPGNNGGDGYVAAAALSAAGIPVRVAASDAPRTEAAMAARNGWSGPVKTIEAAAPAPVLLDALFGTGLTRPLEAGLANNLQRLAESARLAIAVDLPSGVSTDDGAVLGDIPTFDLTLALGALKPSHVLQPAAVRCGKIRVLDIGVPVTSDAAVIGQPLLPTPGIDSHKYSRGLVAVLAGEMPGASELAALAALRAGAGYVLLLGGRDAGAPHAIVRRAFAADALDDPRIGALVIGPGLGRNQAAVEKLEHAIGSPVPLIIDGDALRLLDAGRLAGLSDTRRPLILTPHGGEFDAMFGPGDGGKIGRCRAAAVAAGAVVVFKGADTVIADPAGNVRVAPWANRWLSTAGTGDVLAGAIGACLAAGLSPLDAAAAGAWLHAVAAKRLGSAFIADDLAEALTEARGTL